MSNAWSEEQLNGFNAAAQSLKLYRRAELEDENQKSLIKDLYVDPLPADHVFNTVLRPNTTFLIGRKGTGKSTIFQRVQYELRHMSGYASAYVDITDCANARTWGKHGDRRDVPRCAKAYE